MRRLVAPEGTRQVILDLLLQDDGEFDVNLGSMPRFSIDEKLTKSVEFSYEQIVIRS